MKRIDYTKLAARKFFECKDLGGPQSLNDQGFWKKPATSTADEIKKVLNESKNKRQSKRS